MSDPGPPPSPAAALAQVAQRRTEVVEPPGRAAHLAPRPDRRRRRRLGLVVVVVVATAVALLVAPLGRSHDGRGEPPAAAPLRVASSTASSGAATTAATTAAPPVVATPVAIVADPVPGAAKPVVPSGLPTAFPLPPGSMLSAGATRSDGTYSAGWQVPASVPDVAGYYEHELAGTTLTATRVLVAPDLVTFAVAGTGSHLVLRISARAPGCLVSVEGAPLR